MSKPSSRFDVVATITIQSATLGTEVVKVLREDVTSTNGAYRAVRDDANDEVSAYLRNLLLRHRDGQSIIAMP